MAVLVQREMENRLSWVIPNREAVSRQELLPIQQVVSLTNGQLATLGSLPGVALS